MTANFVPPNDLQKANIFKACRITSEEQLDKDLQILRDWIPTQPHLPQKICDVTLKTILVQKKNSLEEAKKQLDRYFSVKEVIPEFFDDQDPASEAIQKSFDVIYSGISSQMTEKGERINIGKLRDPNPDMYDLPAYFKRICMISDLRIKTESIEGGEIFIYDFEGASLGHLAQCTPTLGKHMIDALRIMPMRFKCAIYINAPAGLETVVFICKQFLPEKLQKRIFVYAGGASNLYKHVPQKLLPKDYGGDDLSLEEMTENWRKELLANRDWFLDYASRRSDESKRPKDGKANPRDRYSTQGSFKALSVD